MSVLTSADIQVLSEPFDEKTISVKVQSFNRERTKAMLVCYLQHTDVYARIEKVDPAWTSEVVQTEKGHESYLVRVKMTIKGVSRDNFGEGGDLKGATSDAIKRAAMLFGIGRYLYDSETVWIPYTENTDRYKSFTLEDYKKSLRKDQSPLPVRKSNDPPWIAPEQPTEEDGSTIPLDYRVQFGKWKGRGLEDIYKNFGPEQMSSYHTFLRESSEKKGIAITGQVLEFMEKCEEFLGSKENEVKEPGWDG